MELYIIRHGETVWNTQKRLQGQTDIPLDEKGRMLARKTGQAMNDIPFDQVISSPLIRAVETAQLIMNGRKIPFCTDDRIKEMAFGVNEGKSSMNQEFPMDDPDFHFFLDAPSRYRTPEGGESFRQLLDRTGSFLEDLKDRDDRSCVLVSTHGAAMRALLMNITKVPLDQFWQKGVPANCSAAHIVLQDGCWIQTEEEKVYAVL